MMSKINNWFEENSENGYAAVRIITGLLLAYHGLEIFDSKVMNGYLEWDIFKTGNGKFLTYLGKALELVGGIMITVGYWTRLASIFTIGTMIYICFIIGKGQFWYADQHPFLFILLAAIFLFKGGGKFSFSK